MKTIKKITLVIALLISAIGIAQNNSVQGTVLDGSFGDEPLAFAHVSVKGIDIEAQTSIDGNFELHLLEGEYTLVVDFIGYAALEIPNVVVTNENIRLRPVVLRAATPGYDVVTASNGQ